MLPVRALASQHAGRSAPRLATDQGTRVVARESARTWARSNWPRGAANPLASTRGELLEIRADFTPAPDSEVVFKVRGVEIRYDAAKQEITVDKARAPAPLRDWTPAPDHPHRPHEFHRLRERRTDLRADPVDRETDRSRRGSERERRRGEVHGPRSARVEIHLAVSVPAIPAPRGARMRVSLQPP